MEEDCGGPCCHWPGGWEKNETPPRVLTRRGSKAGAGGAGGIREEGGMDEAKNTGGQEKGCVGLAAGQGQESLAQRVPCLFLETLLQSL